jgi:site-specific DNA-cytosine methylase
MQSIEFKHNSLSSYVLEHLDNLKGVTKVLKVQRYSNPESSMFNKIKLRISTNWLRGFGFSKGTIIAETVIGPLEGMKIRVDAKGSKSTNDRGYSRKEGRETLIDVQNQTKLRKALGSAEYAHITFTHGELTILPVFKEGNKTTIDAIKLKIKDMKDPTEVNTAIFNAIEYVKDMNAGRVVIDYSEHFNLSKEKVLLSLQLRRIGYRITSQGTNRITFSSTKLPENADDADDNLPVEIISPLETVIGHKEEILQQFNQESPYHAMAICSSGVDIKAMESDGFTVSSVLDYRPPEARDTSPAPYAQKKYSKLGFSVREDSKKVIRKSKWKKMGAFKDKTESGAICAAVNSFKPEIVFNEDIYLFDLNRSTKQLKATQRQNVFFGSLQCDDVSLCKNNNDKERSIVDMSSTIDMSFPMLKTIKDGLYSVIMIENVEAFANSIECKLFEEGLRSLGYTVETHVHNALDFNGYSSRKRAFVFATVLDTAIAQPEKITERTAHFWNDIVAPNINQTGKGEAQRFRNVSHTGGIKTYTAGLLLSKKDKSTLNKTQMKQVEKYQRANVRLNGASHCGTILKSQSRQVAESLYVKVEDEYLFPDNEICKQVMGIPSDFDVSMLSGELGSEVIGQSVDFKVHKALGGKIKEHIDNFLVNMGIALSSLSDQVSHATKCTGEAIESNIEWVNEVMGTMVSDRIVDIPHDNEVSKELHILIP